jgi:hypothetical protein
MSETEITAASLDLSPEVVTMLGRSELDKISTDDVSVGPSGRLVLISRGDGEEILIFDDDVRTILGESSSDFGDFYIRPRPTPKPTPHPTPHPYYDGSTGFAGGLYEPELPEPSSIQTFVGNFLVEIKALICKNKSKTLGHTTTGALAALAGWMAQDFGISSHAAVAVAAAVLVMISSAAKGAFCKMTLEQATETFPKPQKKTKSRRADGRISPPLTPTP